MEPVSIPANEPGTAVKKWFCNEVFIWRSTAAVFWSALVSWLVLIVLTCLLTAHILAPFDLLKEVTVLLLSPTNWFPIAIFLGSTCLLVIRDASCLTVGVSLPSSILNLIVTLLHPRAFLRIVGDTVAAVAQCWCLLWVALGRGVGTFVKSDESGVHHVWCLDEWCLFVICCCALAAFCSSIQSIIAADHIVTFPILEQPKYFRLRDAFVSTVSVIAWRSVRHVQAAVLLYWCFGGIPKSALTYLLQLELDPHVRPVNTVLGLLSPTLLFTAWLITTGQQLAYKMSSQILHTFQAQTLNLPILPVLESGKDLTLAEALRVRDAPLLAHLTFRQLSAQAATSSVARQQLFSLSHPGGHPHTWRKVSHACLTDLQDLTNDVMTYNKAELGVGYRTAPRPQRLQELSDQPPNSTSDSILRKRFGSPWKNSGQSINDTATLKPSSQMLGIFKEHPLIAALVREFPEVRSRSLFVSAQRHVWAVEALSLLAVASYSEDRHGVVQRSLPHILDTFLRLYETLERHLKLAGGSRRGSHPLLPSVQAGVKLQLRDAVRAALYRLCRRFALHFKDLGLSFEQRSRLETFIQYRE